MEYFLCIGCEDIKPASELCIIDQLGDQPPCYKCKECAGFVNY